MEKTNKFIDIYNSLKSSCDKYNVELDVVTTDTLCLRAIELNVSPFFTVYSVAMDYTLLSSLA